MKLLSALAVLATAGHVSAKAVFAHFMVGNTDQFSVQDWKDNMALAQQAHIQAFALNVANGDIANGKQIPQAFEAANAMGFKLFFSFDYAGGYSGVSGFPVAQMDALLKTYVSNGAYWKRGSQPLVSTFEGTRNYKDWAGTGDTLKTRYNVFFIPSYSSLGAQKAMNTGVVDGLFSWGAWPNGPARMTNDVDASYIDFLGGKPYMMPVSPWFYTNMPGFTKNWLWTGDNSWYDRWIQIWVFQPEYVEIITWNDFGECHYIGPLDDRQYSAFDIGKSPYNYALNMPHDKWRMFLPFVIDAYVNDNAQVTQTGVQIWYRVNPNGAGCNTGGTTGNTASQAQTEYSPTAMMADAIFFSALMGSDATVTVTVGGVSVPAQWTTKPLGNVGLFHGSAQTGGRTGRVVVTVAGIATVTGGKDITNDCSATGGYQNFNAFVDGAYGPTIAAKSMPKPVSQQNCSSGTGVPGPAIPGAPATTGLKDLCEFSCQYGYCPPTACTCFSLGVPSTEPKTLQVDGYPAAGQQCVYQGLCSYDCNHNHCPSDYCSTDASLKDKCVLPPADTSLPPDGGSGGGGTVCTGGHGDGNFGGLCSFACHFGFCPSPCSCDSIGLQVPLPAETGKTWYAVAGESSDYTPLCEFAAKYGYNPMPTAACSDTDASPGFFFEDPSVCEPDSREIPTYNWSCVDESCLNWDTSVPSAAWKHYDAQTCLHDVYQWAILAADFSILKGSRFEDHLCDTIMYYFGGKTPPYDAEKGPQYFECQLIGDNGDSCDANDVKCGSLQYRAVEMVMTSFANAHAFFNTIYDSLGDVSDQLSGESLEIAKTFVVDQDSKTGVEIFKGIIGALSGVLAIAGGQFWLKALSGTAFSGVFEKGVNTATALAGAAAGFSDTYEKFAENAESTFEKTIEASESVDQIAANLTSSAQGSIDHYLQFLFEGSADGGNAIISLLDQGAFLAPVDISQYKMADIFKPIMLSKLIASAWELDKKGYPVILYQDTETDDNPGDGGGELTDSTATATRVKHNGATIYLLNTLPCDRQAGGGLVPSSCKNRPFNKFMGTDDLREQGNEWGFQYDDMAISAYEGWLANGKKNPYPLVKSSGTAGDLPFKDGIASPGFFGFPVCTYESALQTWRDHNSTPKNEASDVPCSTYPCC